MKNKSFLLAFPLLLTTSAVLAADPPKPTQQHTPTDHSQMQHGEMDHSKPADHQKMAANEFAALDKNKDGKLNKTELAKDSPVRPHFDMLDADKNGSLSSK